jgi:hypothetical protein
MSLRSRVLTRPTLSADRLSGSQGIDLPSPFPATTMSRTAMSISRSVASDASTLALSELLGTLRVDRANSSRGDDGGRYLSSTTRRVVQFGRGSAGNSAERVKLRADQTITPSNTKPRRPLANSGKPRFTLGLVGVRSGRIRYFDSRDEKIGLDHLLGSSAVPPTFPAVRIDGEAYWDGGIYSNTPLEVVFDDYPRRSCVVFAVQIWHTRGEEPESVAQVFARQNVRQPIHEPYRGAGQAPPHAARRSHAGQHAPRGEAKHPRGPGARRLRLRNHHASARDQCRAARRREQFSGIRLFPSHHRCALAGRIPGYVPRNRAAAVGQSEG